MKIKLPVHGGVFFAGICMLCAVTSCVKQGWEPCGNKLCFVYDYNIDFVDKFPMQVSYLTVFAFDSASGLFDHQFEVKGEPFTENFEMDAPASLFGKEFDLIVWAGLDERYYQWPELEKGVSVKEDLQVKLMESILAAGGNSSKLEPLWYGYLEKVSYNNNGTGNVETVSLMKNTNTFRLVIKSLVPDYVALNENFNVSFNASDSWMGYDNSILCLQSDMTSYLPYYRFNDPQTGAVFEWNSLRLMADRDQFLIIQDNSTGNTLFKIPMNDYLNSLRVQNYSQMPLQEYLDREDNYGIVIFIVERDPGKEQEWLSVRVAINGWVIREQDIQ